MMTWYEIVPLSKQLFWGEWCDLPLYSSLFLLSISSFHLISLPFGFILLVSSRRILLPTSSPHHFPHLSISPVLNLLSSYVSNRYLQNTIPLHCPFCRKICSLTLSLLNFVSIFIHYSSVLFFVWSVCLDKKKNSKSNDGHISFIIFLDMVCVFALYYCHTFAICRSDIIIYYMFNSSPCSLFSVIQLYHSALHSLSFIDSSIILSALIVKATAIHHLYQWSSISTLALPISLFCYLHIKRNQWNSNVETLLVCPYIRGKKDNFWYCAWNETYR